MERQQTFKLSQTANRKAKRNKPWDAGVIVICLWEYLDPLVFHVIWGSLGALG